MDKQQLEDALVNAHQNGDFEAAQLFATELKAYKEPSFMSKVAREANILARGAAVPVTGAIGGGLVAGPAGAVAGSLALPAAELVAKGLNLTGLNVGSPTQKVESFLTKAGFPEPSSTGERALQAAGSALGGVGGQIGALQKLGTTAQSEFGRGLAKTLSQSPERQLLAAAPSAASGQYVSEKTGSPLLGMLASVGTAAPFAIGAKPLESVKVPTIEELKSQAGQQYKFAEEAGAVFKKNSFNKFASNLESDLVKEGVDKTLHPKVIAALERIKDVKGNDVTLEKMDILRKIGQSSAASIDPSERRLGSILVDKLDNFVEGVSTKDLKAGTTEAIDALKTGRELWKRAKKTEILDDIFNSADLRAEANYSQSGMENALRRKLVNLADNAKKMRAFTPTEQNAIRATAKGGSIQNVLRWAGKLSPSSVIAAGGAGYIGSSLFGPAGAVIAPAAGLAAKYGATKIGLSNFKNLEDMLKLGFIPEQPISPYTTLSTRGVASTMPSLLGNQQ